MKLLIVDDEEDLVEIVAMVVETQLNFKAVIAKSGNAAIDLLKNDAEISGVVCDYNMKDGTGGDVYTFLKQTNRKIPYILCSSDSPQDHQEFDLNDNTPYIQKPFNCSDLSKIIKDNIRGSVQAQGNTYSPVKIKHLLRSSVLNFDYYIKISDGKFVKILKKGDLFSKNDHDSYLGRGIDAFYLEAKDMMVFLEEYSREVIVLSKARGLSPDTGLTELAKTYETVHEIVTGLGFSREAVDLAKASAQLAVSVVSNDVQFSDFSKSLKANPENYIHYHSMLLTHISCLLASVAEVSSDLVQFKLALASLLHDVCLSEANAIVEFDSPSPGQVTSDPSMIEFRKHPAKAAEMIQRLQGLPAGLDQLILRHHERPDGTGFPNKLTSKDLEAVEAVFILAHDLTNVLYLSSERKNMINFIKKNENVYTGHHFGKVFAKLKLFYGI